MLTAEGSAVAATVVRQLGLLQVLFVLPVNVLQDSFASGLDHADRGTFRLVCRDACSLLFTITNKLVLQLFSPLAVTHVAAFVQKFTRLVEVTLIPTPDMRVDSEMQAHFPDSLLVQLLYKCRKPFSTVSTLHWECFPLTYNISLALAVAMPQLTTLDLENSDLKRYSPVFEPLSTLVSVSILDDYHPFKNQEALTSLLQVPTLHTLRVGWCGLPRGVSVTGSAVREVTVCELDDNVMEVLTQLLQLEVLHIRGGILVTHDCVGRLPRLKQLHILGGEGVNNLLRLLPQPQLKQIFWDDPGLDIEADHNVLPQEWQVTVSHGLDLLERCCTVGSFPLLRIDGSTVTRAQFLALLKSWPVMTQVEVIILSKVTFGKAELACLALKAPQLKQLYCLDCTAAGDGLLSCVCNFRRLEDFAVHGSTAVSSVGLTALAVKLGKRKVCIRGDPELLGVEAPTDLIPANALLATCGVCSTVVAGRYMRC